MSSLAPHLPAGGRGILAAAMCSNLPAFLGRRDLNSVIAADPTLFWRDPHPGRMIHACNRRDMLRLRALLDCPGAPYGWPARRYRRFGNTYDASTLFEAAVHAYWEEGALLAVALQPWTAKTAARAILDHVRHTSWTAVADALVAKAGPAVITRLQEPDIVHMCLTSQSDCMIRWFVAHGLDPNTISSFDRRSPLDHFVRFTVKDKVDLLLSLGARPDAEMLALCFDRYHEYRSEDPEGSGDWDAMEVLRMLIPTAPLRTLSRHGFTALHTLVSEVWGREDLLRLMIQHGADVNQRDIHGRSALWHAQHPEDSYPYQPYVTALLAAGGK
jgi:hypothetical protein